MTGGYVIVSGRDAERGEQTVEKIRAMGGTADFIAAAQSKLIQQLQTRLDRSEARFHAWADEVPLRDDARAKREEALPFSARP